MLTTNLSPGCRPTTARTKAQSAASLLPCPPSAHPAANCAATSASKAASPHGPRSPAATRPLFKTRRWLLGRKPMPSSASSWTSTASRSRSPSGATLELPTPDRVRHHTPLGSTVYQASAMLTKFFSMFSRHLRVREAQPGPLRASTLRQGRHAPLDVAHEPEPQQTGHRQECGLGARTEHGCAAYRQEDGRCRHAPLPVGVP